MRSAPGVDHRVQARRFGIGNNRAGAAAGGWGNWECVETLARQEVAPIGQPTVPGTAAGVLGLAALVDLTVAERKDICALRHRKVHACAFDLGQGMTRRQQSTAERQEDVSQKR
jgi:hypothetical protein